MNNYNSKPQKPYNPFLDDDDNKEVDDFDFLNHPQQGSSGYMLGNDKPNQEWEQKRRQLLEERRQIEERTLMSTNKSLGLVYESEQIGIQTAEELMRQREQLRNTEYKVDEVNGMLRSSQKHLNVMKSIFGGIKSYFTGATPETDATKPMSAFEKPESPASSKLQSAVTMSKEETELAARQGYSHPALKARGLDTSGFKEVDDDDDDEDEKFMYGGSGRTSLDMGYRSQSALIEQKLDENLGEMGAGLSRLKHLALGLGEEIEDQNDMLERLADKTERAEITIKHQNRQIGHILKK